MFDVTLCPRHSGQGYLSAWPAALGKCWQGWQENDVTDEEGWPAPVMSLAHRALGGGGQPSLRAQNHALSQLRLRE